MADEDPVRRIIRDYSYADPSEPPMGELRKRWATQRRRRTLSRLAAAAVLVLIVGALAVWVVNARVSGSVPPVGPTPPIPTATPSPTPTTTSPSPTTTPGGFPVQERDSGGAPTGGVGDTLDGIRLDSIDITTTSCPDADICPDVGTLTVTNTSSTRVRAEVRFTVYRDNREAVGDGQGVDLAPGETATVRVETQPMLADNAPPPGASGGIYSWNFSVIPQG